MPKQAFFVTGASGWIGQQVCIDLKRRGYLVVACSPSAPLGRSWDAFLRLDLEIAPSFDRVNMEEVMKMAERWTMIHCAGYAHRWPETPNDVSRFYAINHEGTQKVVDWCRTSGIRRLIYVSSTAVYDWDSLDPTAPVTEEANLASRTAYADSKLKGEQVVRQSGLDFCVVRLATVFGIGDKGNFAKLAKALRCRKFLLPGRGHAQKSVISVELAASCLTRLATMNDVSKTCFNLGISRAPSLSEISLAFCRHCDFPEPKRVPLWLFVCLGRVGDLLVNFAPAFPLTSEAVRKLTRPTHIDSSRAVAILPELTQTSFSEELKKSSAYYKTL